VIDTLDVAVCLIDVVDVVDVTIPVEFDALSYTTALLLAVELT
jgi:hypothetical protein